MDVYCRYCGEPWDMAELHDVRDEGTGRKIQYPEASNRFRQIGCAVFDGKCEPLPRCLTAARAHPEAAAKRTAIYEIAGDDMDGAAADFDDFGSE